MSRRPSDSEEMTTFVDRSALAPRAEPEITLFRAPPPRSEKPDSVTVFVRASTPSVDDDDDVYTNAAPLAADAGDHVDAAEPEDSYVPDDAYAPEEAYAHIAEPPPVASSRRRHFNPDMETVFAKVPAPKSSSRRAPLGNTGATPVRPVEEMLAKRRTARPPHDLSLFQPLPSAVLNHPDVVTFQPPMDPADIPLAGQQAAAPVPVAHPGFQLMPAMMAQRPIPPPESSVRPWMLSGGGPSSGFGPPLRTPPKVSPSVIATASLAFLMAAMFLGGILFLRSEPSPAATTNAVAPSVPETSVLPAPAVPPVTTVESAPPIAPIPTVAAPISVAPTPSPATAAPPPQAQPDTTSAGHRPPPTPVATARPVGNPPPPPPAPVARPQAQSPKKSAKSVEDILNELGEEQLRR